MSVIAKHKRDQSGWSVLDIARTFLVAASIDAIVEHVPIVPDQLES